MCKQVRTIHPRPPTGSAAHDRVGPLLGAYVLGALEHDEGEDVRAHLVACAACRGEARQLTEAASFLVDGSPAPGPSAELWERIAASVRRADPHGDVDGG